MYGGIVSTDPFLTVKNAGVLLGYHFSESFGVWAPGSSTSFRIPVLATLSLKTVAGIRMSTTPLSLWEQELSTSFFYGKLSFINRSIMHYDLQLTAGAGITKTDDGNLMTPTIGIGQQIFLSESFTLRLDYRFMFYKEAVYNRVDNPNYGAIAYERTNYTNIFNLGWGSYSE